MLKGYIADSLSYPCPRTCPCPMQKSNLEGKELKQDDRIYRMRKTREEEELKQDGQDRWDEERILF